MSTPQTGRVSLLDRFRLDGKVALVTGAGQGIGEGLALALAEAGADLAIVGRTADKLERVTEKARAYGRQALPVVADVGELGAIQSIVDQTVARFGKIDVLVNNAGVTRRQDILDVTPDDWDYLVSINLRSVYFLSQAVGRVMIERGGGKILNIASMNSYRGFVGVSVYGLTKAAIAHFTKSLAVEWAPHNIQANAIAPGWIETPMISTMNPDRRRWVEDHLPRGKFGKPEDLAPLAVYLVSSAGDYTTGQVYPVDGGFLAGNPWTVPGR